MDESVGSTHESARRLAGRSVFPLAVGTAALTFEHADDPARAFRLVEGALAAGVRVFDTALAYSTAEQEGHAESSLRAALEDCGAEDVIVVTKGGHWRDGDAFPVDGRAATLQKHVEGSRRRLGLDTLPLYLLHHPDPATPIEVSLEALTRLQEAGAIDAIGVSNVSLDQYERARRVAPIAAIQNPRSVFAVGDQQVLDAARRDDVAFLAYSPLRGRDSASPRLRETLDTVSRRHAVNPAEVALSWLVTDSPVVVPVSGATRSQTVTSAAAGVRLQLAAEEMERIDECVTR